MANFPNTDKQFKRSPTDYSIIFRPGGETRGFTFANFADVSSFVQGFNDGDIVVGLDFSLMGGEFLVPIDEYDLQKVILSGVTGGSGEFPRLLVPEGVTLNSNNSRLRMFQLEFCIQSTTTPITTPAGAFRVQQDLSRIVADGNTAPLVDMANGGAFSASIDRNSGFENAGGTELVSIPAGGEATIFLESDSFVDADMIELADSSASLTVFFEGRSRFDSQTGVPAASLTKVSTEQSGADFPQEAYAGKLFHKLPAEFMHAWSQTANRWRRQEEGALTDYVAPIATNSIAGSFVNRHNFNFDFEAGAVYEIHVEYFWNYGATSNSWRSQLLINGVQQGVLDNNGVRYFHTEDPQDGGTGPAGDHVVGTDAGQRLPFYQVHRYTAGATSSLPVVLRWGPEANVTAAIWGSLIRIRRAPA